MLLNRYREKIKTPEELAKLIGFPVAKGKRRKRTVVLCNGVFDVVHPGHFRHLLYARDKADILIASLTADVHVHKGTNRPHVPQDMRALSLAALECVDYVVIDVNPKPIELIQLLQPDFYAKGFEYLPSNRSGKAISETEAVEAYGGQILYTPGDLVYSSTKLIEASAPDLRYDTLALVMSRYGVSFDLLRRTVEGMSKCYAHVVGDVIVDSYTYASMIGGQTKTPTLSALFERRVDYVGGAGVVAKHITAAGARVSLSTVLGGDKMAEFALNDLEAAKVDVLAYIDAARPTTNKNAIIVNGYRSLKLDTLDNRSIDDHALNELSQSIYASVADAYVFADFRHGIFNQRTISKLTNAIPAPSMRVADSQVASRWGNITDFKGFDLITPNEREARFSLGDQDSGVRLLGSKLYDATKCGLLLMKMGPRGLMACVNAQHEATDSYFTLGSFAREVVDAVGAGDALLAYATLGHLITRNPAIAAILGTLAAAVACEGEGNNPVGAEAVLGLLNFVEEQSR